MSYEDFMHIVTRMSHKRFPDTFTNIRLKQPSVKAVS